MQRRERKGVWLSTTNWPERRALLQSLQARREEMLKSLNQMLEARQERGEQEHQRSQASELIDREVERAAQNRSELRRVKEQSDKLRKVLAARRAMLESRIASLTKERLAHVSMILPADLRTHQLALLHARMGLYSDQRNKLQQLLDILPIRVIGLRSAPAPATLAHQLSHAASAPPAPGAAGSSGQPAHTLLPSATGLAAQAVAHAASAAQFTRTSHVGGASSTEGSTHQPPAPMGPVFSGPAPARLSLSSEPARGAPGLIPGSTGGGVMLGPSGAFIPALSYLPPSANCGSIALSLCGIRVPDSLRGDNWPLQQQQELSAVLGYMLLLLDLMASYLGSPLLHEGSYQGSTTVVWQQQSFWNRRPLNRMNVLPLFVEASGPLGAAAVTPIAKAKTSMWAALPLLRAASSTQGSGGSSTASTTGGSPGEAGRPGASGGQDESEGRRWRHADLRSAFTMLQRSCSSLVRDALVTALAGVPPPSSSAATASNQSGLGSMPTSLGAAAYAGAVDTGSGQPSSPRAESGAGLQGADAGSQASSWPPALPLSWSPWGWLTVLASALLQEDNSPAPRLSGVLTAAAGAVRAEQELLTSLAAANAAGGIDGFTGGALNLLPLGAEGLLLSGHPEGEEGLVTDELEGWDVVRPILPPPPSATEDVEQYARALYEQQHHPRSSNNNNGLNTSIGLGGSSGLALSGGGGGLRAPAGGGGMNHSGSGGVPSQSGGAGTPTTTASAAAALAASTGMARLGSLLRGTKS